MIFHIPHDATEIPRHCRKAIQLNDTALAKEVRLMTDWFTADLFAPAARRSDAVVRFPISRLIVDPERFDVDTLEAMAEVGMGVIYERTAFGQVLRAPPTVTERHALLEEFYRPHHAVLAQAVSDEIARGGASLIIDCHSFPARPLPYELDQSPDRPDICLGTDPIHSPAALVTRLARAFEAAGLAVAINKPFFGALVPAAYYRTDRRVQAVMIEVNRSLYMDEVKATKAENFAEVQRIVGRAVTAIDGAM
jgi:N-formylglutamate amidohydrolase